MQRYSPAVHGAEQAAAPPLVLGLGQVIKWARVGSPNRVGRMKGCLYQTLLHVVHAIATKLVQKQTRVQMAALHDHGLAISHALSARTQSMVSKPCLSTRTTFHVQHGHLA